MGENHVMKAFAGDVYFRTPQEEPPPRGVKLLILTSGGVCVIGDWRDDGGFWAWSPLPKKRRRGQDVQTSQSPDNSALP